MGEIVNLRETEGDLWRLVERAIEGEDIVIAYNGKPLVRLTPMQPPSVPVNAESSASKAHDSGRPRVRKAGLLKGQIWMSDDFDDPLPDDIQRCFDEWNEEDLDVDQGDEKSGRSDS